MFLTGMNYTNSNYKTQKYTKTKNYSVKSVFGKHHGLNKILEKYWDSGYADGGGYGDYWGDDSGTYYDYG